MARVIVVGAGVMGLAAAHHALGAGHDVTVVEGDRVPGGMAAHLDFDGMSIERFYHFVCKADQATFDLLGELGLGGSLRWRDTSMGYFIDGHHYGWGDPVSLLRFPLLDPWSKIRYGLQMFMATKRTSWRDLEEMSAKDWFIASAGHKAYDLLWRRLFELKFYEHADNISAAWMWTRIKRVGTSRRSIFQEELGYINGGSETLVRALVDSIQRRGGTLRLGAPVSEIAVEGRQVTGVRVGDAFLHSDAVISTVPTPLIAKLVPGLPDESRVAYAGIRNIGVVCVLLRLKRSVSRHFWLNINDPRIEIPGLVEFSNLRPMPDHIVYVPYYMPQHHPKFERSDEAFVAEAFSYMRLVNSQLGPDDLLGSHVGRLRFAQPVCEPGFLSKIPAVLSPVRGLQIADTCFYYPEDRGISESVRYGKLMAKAVADPSIWERKA